MNILELEKSKMDVLKELADTSMKISEAKNLLFKLQEDETAYLVGREEKALEKIQKVFDDSKDLLQETAQNYQKLHELCVTATQFSDYLQTGYATFQHILQDFNERNEQWDQAVKKQENDFQELRKALEIDKNTIKNDKKNLESARKRLEDDQKRLESDRGTIQRTIERLKSNKI